MEIKRCWTVFSLVFLMLLPMGAVAGTVVDDFSVPHDYIDGNTEGTIWDGLFFGDDPGDIGTVAAITTTPDDPAFAGTLYMESAGTHFNHQGMDSPFLYINVVGDFVATVQVVDLAPQSWNEAGICARIAKDSDGSNEDYVWARRRGWSASTQFRNLDNGTKTDHATSDNVEWIGLRREGNDFIMSISEDGVTYTDTFTMTRDDMDGLPLQVGIVQAGYAAENDNWAYFDNFSLTAANVGGPQASALSPSDGEKGVLKDAVLSWAPGLYADTHNVYFGTEFEEVQAADSTSPLLVASGGTDTTYQPESVLSYGKTYFWRIDEVNDLDPNSPWTGDVWSFTVETYAQDLPASAVKISAVNSAAGQDPNDLINGSGLNEDGQHGTNSGDMWTSGGGDGGTSLIFALDREYKLDQIRVWNSNQTIENLFKLGAKDVTIDTSPDGIAWTPFKSVVFPQAPGNDQYEGDLIDLNATAQYLRLNLESNYAGNSAVPIGLSEIRLTYIPVWPTDLAPADGSTGLPPNPILTWRAGREAAQHKVYVGTDPENLPLADTVIAPGDEASYDTAPLDLQLGQMYYWRIDEVNEAQKPTTWMGDVQSFTVGNTLSIDDMESYNDKAGFRIYEFWSDGYEVTGNGSTVGIGDNPETAYLHEGSNSMPLFFSNTVTDLSSEATLSLGGMDFDRAGIQGLELFISGYPDDGATSQLYVIIDGKKISYTGNALAGDAVWRRWYIPLADMVGVDLDAVNSLTVGFEGAGSGVLYVDSIRLTPQPAPTSGNDPLSIPDLVVHYGFDGDAVDTVGAFPATLMADPNLPTFVDQALKLDGGYAVVEGFKGVLARADMQHPFSLACWFQTSADGCLLGWGSPSGGPVGGQYCLFRIHGGSLRIQHGNGNLRGDTAVADGEWHHGAVTVIANATLQTPDTTIYVDGQADTTFSGSINIWNVYGQNDMLIGESSWTGDAALVGSIDEVRVYNRTLTPEEIGQLAAQ